MVEDQPYEFDVAISYAEGDRPKAQALFDALKDRGIKTFYNRDQEARLWGENRYDFVFDLHHHKSRYCVMLLSKNYATERWSKLERQAAQASDFDRHKEYILPVRLDDTEITGVNSTVYYLEWPPQTAETITNLVEEKLGRITHRPLTPVTPAPVTSIPSRRSVVAASFLDTVKFQDALVKYVRQAEQARRYNEHRSERRRSFVVFLQDAFAIGVNQVDLRTEGVVQVDKAWVEAVFKDVVFLFKQNLELEQERGKNELRDYLLSRGAESIGLLTDGLRFIAYILDDSQTGGLQEFDDIQLEKVSATKAGLWFDALLLKQTGTKPTSVDIVHHFGLSSPSYVMASNILHRALSASGERERGALEAKRQQWAFHVARVYGRTDIINDDTFIRHTYLCQFAKMLVYTARFGVAEAVGRIEGIITGSAFQVLGVDNIGENDFFAWVLSSEAHTEALAVFRRLAASLVIYDLSTLLSGDDLLKLLYQNLIEPDTRHDLGTYYTPKWLAELILDEIEFEFGQSLLDPACGSGTFLCAAIHRLIEQGKKGQELVNFALDHIAGMDVHPLAVTISRIYYMLAILPHIVGGQDQHYKIPISMSNSLLVPTKSEAIEAVQVPVDDRIVFRIPADAASSPPRILNEVLDAMQRTADTTVQIGKNPADADYEYFIDFALQKTSSSNDTPAIAEERAAWHANVCGLATLIAERRDSIWTYVLQNISRPLFLTRQKFDVVVGNPPWIAYRYIQDQTYQEEIKKLVLEHQLLNADQVELYTQMEVATLFFEHCRTQYLKPEGTIAFVMPRSVLTGAKQHEAFQRVGFSHILDFQDVAPLFNVEACVLIRESQDVLTEDIPSTGFSGKLPAHDCSWAVATTALSEFSFTTDLPKQGVAASPYYAKMINGATLYPRTLVFVASAEAGLTPGQLAHTKLRRTDPEVVGDAKQPWRDISLEGYIDDAFLYATVLSKHLVH